MAYDVPDVYLYIRVNLRVNPPGNSRTPCFLRLGNFHLAVVSPTQGSIVRWERQT